MRIAALVNLHSLINSISLAVLIAEILSQSSVYQSFKLFLMERLVTCLLWGKTNLNNSILVLHDTLLFLVFAVFCLNNEHIQ